MAERRQGTPKLTDEQKLEMLNERLTELKAEFKAANTPSTRQLINVDIADTLDRIYRLQQRVDASN